MRMRNNRIPFALLTGALVLAVTASLVGETYARYENERYHRITYQTESTYKMPSSYSASAVATAPTDWGMTAEDWRNLKQTAMESSKNLSSGGSAGLTVLQSPLGTGPLILAVTYPQGSDTLVLRTAEGDFLEDTWYASGNGSWKCLSEAGEITLTGERLLMVDVAGLWKEETDTILLDAYFLSEGAETATEEILVGYQEIEIRKQEEEAGEVLLQGSPNPILSEDKEETENALCWWIPYTATVEGMEVSYTVEIEYLGPDGSYTKDLPDAGLTAECREQASGNGAFSQAGTAQGTGVLVLSIHNGAGEKRAFAGTYRAIVSCKIKIGTSECSLQSVSIPFFVNYR